MLVKYDHAPCCFHTLRVNRELSKVRKFQSKVQRSSCEKIKDRINTNRLFVILFKCRECREEQDQIIQNVSILCRECRHGSFYSTLNLIDFMSLVSRDQRQNSVTNNIECIDLMSWVSTRLVLQYIEFNWFHVVSVERSKTEQCYKQHRMYWFHVVSVDSIYFLRFTLYLLIQSLRFTMFFELNLRIRQNFELNLRITSTSN